MPSLDVILLCLCVTIGGVVGAWIRWCFSLLFKNKAGGFDFATLFVNVIACLFLGVVQASSLTTSFQIFYAALALGFCGALSTFSTFAVNVVLAYLEDKRLCAATEVFSNLLFCFLAFFVGSYLGGLYAIK